MKSAPRSLLCVFAYLHAKKKKKRIKKGLEKEKGVLKNEQSGSSDVFGSARNRSCKERKKRKKNEGEAQLILRVLAIER